MKRLLIISVWLVLAVLFSQEELSGQEVKINTPILENNMPRSASFGVIWDTPRSIWMPRCAVPPQIDGKLDDTCWKDAALLTGFIAPPNRTRNYKNAVFLCYDETNLYLGGRFGEPHPERIKAIVKEDGIEAIWQDDCLEIHLQVDSEKLYVDEVYKNKPTWLQLITNSIGAKFSQLVVERRPGNFRYRLTNWNDEWRVKGKVGDDAWYSEIAIPWEKLKITPVEGAFFKMNAGRNFPYNPQSWNTQGYHNPRMFGTVYFGREGEGGVEIRSSQVDCAGENWRVRVDVLGAGDTQVEVRLKTILKKGENIIVSQAGNPRLIGEQPVSLTLPLRVEEEGSYKVEIQLLTASGDILAKGHVETIKHPILERFFLFRHELFVGEEIIRGYYRLGALPGEKRLTTSFELLDEKRNVLVVQGKSQPLTRTEGQFDFLVPPLSAGNYFLRFRVVDDRDTEFVGKEVAFRVKEIVPIKRRSFTVHIDESVTVSRTQWPITVGVPFGEGMLAIENVEKHTRVLDASGQEIPCQTRVLVTWTEAKRYARWVLFDVQADLVAGKGTDLTIEFGTEVTRASQIEKNLIVEGNDEFVIDTGPLHMIISKKEPLFFNRIKFDGKHVTQKVEVGELYLKTGDPSIRGNLLPHQLEYDVDRSLETFLAELSYQDYTIEVEYNGPLRSVIRATGWYGTKEEERLFKYILRLYVYKGKAFIHGFHTFIVTKPEQYIDSLGLRIRSASRQSAVLLGKDENQTKSFSHVSSYTKPELSLFQPSAEYYRIAEFLKLPNQTDRHHLGTQLDSGHRAAGWFDLSYGTHSLLVGIKDFWQEYPKELSVDPAGLIELGFVSAKGFEHLDLRSEPFAESEKAGGDSEGIAKTTRFVLDFHKPDHNEQATVKRAKAAMEDLTIWIDPSWMQEADPFWMPVTRATPDSQDYRKQAYAHLVDMAVVDQFQRPDQVNGLSRYGILNYGDRMHTNPWRGWYNNEDYAYPFSEWVAYLATGNRKMLESVQAFSRHLMDVDTLNYISRKDPGLLGLQSRHRRLHWGQPGSITHTYLDQSLLYYYLFGYERGADHADLIQAGQRVLDWWPNDGWWDPEKNPQGAVARDYGVNMRVNMNAYRHLWDPVLLVRAHELWGRYKQGFLPGGGHIISYFSIPRALELYARYTQDPEALAIIRNSNILPGLSAELGRMDKLAQSLSNLDALYASSFKRIPVPAGALQYNGEGTEAAMLQSVTVMGHVEQLIRQGKKVHPAPSSLYFNGDKELVFLEEDDQEHQFQVLIVGGSPATHGTVTIVDPVGNVVDTIVSEIAALPLFDDVTKQLDFAVPEDGLSGQYTLRFEGFGTGYRRLRIKKGPRKRIYRIDPQNFRLGYWYGQKFWFYVPQGCETFKIGARPVNRSDRYGFVVFDPDNHPVASKNWYFNTAQDTPITHTVKIEVPKEQRERWWSIGYKCKKDLTFIWPDVLPPYVTDGPDAGFLPKE